MGLVNLRGRRHSCYRRVGKSVAIPSTDGTMAETEGEPRRKEEHTELALDSLSNDVGVAVKLSNEAIGGLKHHFEHTV